MHEAWWSGLGILKVESDVSEAERRGWEGRRIN